MTKPTVLIPCDVKMLGEYPFHSVGEKYISAVAHSAGAMPLLLPAWGASKEMSSLTGHYDIPSLLDRIDGVLLPGSYSNVHPRWYRGDDVDMELDEQRDETVFTLIDEVLARDLPLFAICRGFQELNVSLGGDLQPRLHEQGGRLITERMTPCRLISATSLLMTLLSNPVACLSLSCRAKRSR